MENKTKSILVVEDDDATSALFEAILKEQGYRVILARDGDAGIEQFSRRRFDAVVTDMQLPTISGADVFYRLRSLEPDAKIILSSGNVEMSLISKMKNDGLYCFLAKPFNPKDLVQTIREATAGR